MLASGRFDDEANWTISSHCVEPVATWCLLQPAATRDRLDNIATHAIHHGRLATDPTYKDSLEGDKGNRYLAPPQQERQLAAIGAVWSTLPSFLDHLASVDDTAFRRLTFDFRNQASHSIAPRLEAGFTQMVKRRIEPFQDMVRQPDGAFLLVADPARGVVSYGFGGTPPLPLSNASALVGSAHRKARAAVEAYLALVAEIVAAQRESLTPDVSPLTDD